MTDTALLDNTPVAESIFMGKLITNRPGFMIGPENYTSMYNMRYMPGGLGVETRGGCRRFNDTAAAASNVEKIWQHLYTRWQTQYQDTYVVTAERKLYKADAIPESSAGAGSLGSSLWSLATGASIPSFCQVEDVAVFTNKKEVVSYQGTTPVVDGFYVGYDIDNSTDATAEDNKTFYIYTDEVTDNNTNTSATFTLDTLSTNNANALYVGFFQPISGITFTMGATVNANSATITIQKWTGSAWSSLTVTDGTASSGKTLAQSGSMTWTYDGTEAPRRINGFTLFWYRITTSATLTSSVVVTAISVVKPWAAIKDVTDGYYVYATGFLWYDATDTRYVDYVAEVTADSRASYAKFYDSAADTDMASGDAVYIGFPIRIMGLVLDFVAEYNNDGSASTLTVSYWDGTQWVAYGADEMSDGTSKSSKTFNQNGTIRLEDKGTSVKMTVVGGKPLPMFWYKLTFSAKMYNDANDEMRLWKAQGIPAPITLKKYNCCLNFKDRLFLFGRDDLPNMADYSAYKLPYCHSGTDTSSVQPRITFGKVDDIVAAINFYNEAIIFKRTEVWMMEGDSPATFGTLLLDNTVGCVAPETVRLVKTWTTMPDGRKDFRHAVFFMAQDGIYGVDGIKLWKVSGDIDNYFDPFNAECIKVGYHDDCIAWYDPIKNNYHLVIYSGSTPTQLEFVYDTQDLRWMGPFVRSVPLKCGESLVGSNNERYEYGGGNDGRLYRLEYSNNDVNSSGTAVAIENYVQTADLWKGLQFKYAFNEIHLYGVAQSSGSVTVTLYGNDKSTGVTVGTITMVNSGYGYFAGMRKFTDLDSSGAAMENKFQSAKLRFGTNATGVRQQLFGHLVKKALIAEAAKAT